MYFDVTTHRKYMRVYSGCHDNNLVDILTYTYTERYLSLQVLTRTIGQIQVGGKI